LGRSLIPGSKGRSDEHWRKGGERGKEDGHLDLGAQQALLAQGPMLLNTGKIENGWTGGRLHGEGNAIRWTKGAVWDAEGKSRGIKGDVTRSRQASIALHL